jgi:hypothetical protein
MKKMKPTGATCGAGALAQLDAPDSRTKRLRRSEATRPRRPRLAHCARSPAGTPRSHLPATPTGAKPHNFAGLSQRSYRTCEPRTGRLILASLLGGNLRAGARSSHGQKALRCTSSIRRQAFPAAAAHAADSEILHYAERVEGPPRARCPYCGRSASEPSLSGLIDSVLCELLGEQGKQVRRCHVIGVVDKL